MDKLDLAQTTTDPKILDELSKDKNFYVRYRVAQNLNTIPETLDYLSKDEDFCVRWNVAKNLNTSPEILKQMSIVEENDYVRYYIKNNRNCLLETWKYLSALELLEELSLIYNM
jgi:3-methyladenine DNA glycosylase AlkC